MIPLEETGLGRERLMMGRREVGQGQFFYSFDLDKVVPGDHLVRQIDGVLDLGWVHKELSPYYSHTGRPSIDPVLMIRMLIVGYVFATRSERRLCAEVQVNLAYRWFCKLGIEDKIPDHSVFCRARHERFRESDALRRVFEGVVAMCIAAGLVGGEAFSVDASLIKADVDKKKRVPGDQPLVWPKARKPRMRFESTLRHSMRPERQRQSKQARQGSLADRSTSDMGCQTGHGPVLCL
jgi:transposase